MSMHRTKPRGVRHGISVALCCALLASFSAAAEETTPEIQLMLDSQSRVLESLKQLPASECASCAAAEAQKKNTCDCVDGSGAPVAIEDGDLTAKAQLLWLNQKFNLEEKTRDELKLSLLKEAEELERYSLHSKENPELMHSWAVTLKDLAHAPDVKKRLLTAHDSFNPDLLDLEKTEKESAWRWEKIGKKDYLRLGALALVTGTAEGVFTQTSEPAWTGGTLFDDSARDALLATEKSRLKWESAGDLGVTVLAMMPFIDTLGVLGAVKRDKDAAVQATFINLESFAFTAAVYGTTKGLLARQRPGADLDEEGRCKKSPDCHSFPSGHTAFAFTAAGLICTHHSYLSLYGNATADQSACVASMALATFTGMTRIMADKHYATDVAVGAAIGLFSGLALPRILHYRADKETSRSAIIKEITVSPVVLNRGGGLFCSIPF